MSRRRAASSRAARGRRTTLGAPGALGALAAFAVFAALTASMASMASVAASVGASQRAADDPPELPRDGVRPDDAPPPRLPADLPPETRDRIIEAAIIEALRDELYFGDAIRARLEAPETIGPQVRAAATVLDLPPEQTSAWLARAASEEGRASLATLVPEEDDADAVRTLVRRDLIRIAAPLPDDRVLDDARRERIVSAAKRLLVERMRLPGGVEIWGEVDDEVDRKIRVIVASRAPRDERRPWCELAAWTLVAQRLDERAVGVAQEGAKWLSDAGRPASVDFMAVTVLSERRRAGAGSARALLERHRAMVEGHPELRARLDRAVGATATR